MPDAAPPTTPPATPPAAPAATPPATPPAAPPAWHASLDTDSQGWVQLKGLDKLPSDQAVAELVKGWSGAEKFMGVPADQIMRLPKDGDTAALDAVYSKLGRPADPKGYKFDAIEGFDTKGLDGLRPAFHKLGLNNAQANGLVMELAAQEAAEQATKKAAFDAKVLAENELLQREWGAAHEKNTRVVQGVARELGVSVEAIDALEVAIGTAATLKLFHTIGTKFGGEDRFIGGGPPGFGGVMSPDAARARISVLKNDKEFATKLSAGNVDALAEWNKVHRYAAGMAA